MYVIPYLFSLFVIVISVFVTLSIKSELERLFRDNKSVSAFHFCNLVIILMVAYAANAVMTIYILEKEYNHILHAVILLIIILPCYISGHFLFEKYKEKNRKYSLSEDGKVLVINEKYLGKKRSSAFKNYNDFS